MFAKALTLVSALLAIGSQALPYDSHKNDHNNSHSDHSNNHVNSPSNRAAWDSSHDIHTNYYQSWPKTGVVREYWLEVTNSTFGPDGYERVMLTFNGTYPGPTLYADWGDTLRIHVKNRMQINGTSIHWHGVRQLLTTEMDGTNGVTQCPIAPGDSFTYEWVATQYGTTWYHSHFSLQYSEGVVGGLVIYGPASANYDVDLGPVLMADWYHKTAFSSWRFAQTSGPPVAQNGLINGENVFDCSVSPDAACVGGGKRYEFPEFEYGKKYLLRLVNTGTDTHFRVSLDGHKMTVVQVDFVPVVPYETDNISIGIGQRYNVIIEANACAEESYWFRADVQTTCSAPNVQALNVKAIVRYKGTPSTGEPTTIAGAVTVNCLDEFITSLVPMVPISVPKTDFSNAQDVDVELVHTDTFFWTLNNITANSTMSSPTLLKLLKNEPYPTDYHVLKVPEKDKVYYMVIETQFGVTHPIHLHGHDFYVLAQGTGPFVNSAATINWDNPMRRDVAMLPAGGHVVIGFVSDNPGVWLMHCHIAWHVSAGFALQFVEREDDIHKKIKIDDSWEKTCANWDVYDFSGLDPPQLDSGLRF